MHLAHHILHNPEILLPPPSNASSSFQWPPCVELGSGTGFLSILLAQLGADIIATDLDDGEGERQTPLGRLQVNAGLSASTVELERSRADVQLFMLDPSATSMRIEALDWADALLNPEDQSSIWRELASQNVNRTIVAADVVSMVTLVPLHSSRADPPMTDIRSRHRPVAGLHDRCPAFSFQHSHYLCDRAESKDA